MKAPMIEPARDVDGARLANLLAQMGVDVDRSTFDPTRIRAGYHSLVARDDSGQPIGFVLVTYVDLGAPHEGGGSIELLVVDETQRASGIGAALVEAAIERLQGEGVANVFVSTEAGSTAPEFYRKLGFEANDGPWMVRVIG